MTAIANAVVVPGSTNLQRLQTLTWRKTFFVAAYGQCDRLKHLLSREVLDKCCDPQILRFPLAIDPHRFIVFRRATGDFNRTNPLADHIIMMLSNAAVLPPGDLPTR